MTHFFFNLHTSDDDVHDHEGRDFEGLEAAYAYGLRAGRFEVAQGILGGVLDMRGRIDIADDTGRVLASVRLQDCFHVAVDMS